VLDDVSGNLRRQREWKTHDLNFNQRAWATWMAGATSGSGAAGSVGGGSAFISPGKRKLAGETLWDALIPLQPPPSNAALARSKANPTFLFAFTGTGV
jgi:hypothetical protein